MTAGRREAEGGGEGWTEAGRGEGPAGRDEASEKNDLAGFLFFSSPKDPRHNLLLPASSDFDDMPAVFE